MTSPRSGAPRRVGMALGLLGGLALASCGSPQSAAGTIPGVVPSAVPSTQPSDVAAMTGGAAKTAQQFLADMQGGLCPAAFALVTDPLRTQASTAAGLCGVVSPGSAFTVGSTTTLTTTSAFVGVSVVVAGVPRSETLTLLYQSSQWLVSNITNGSSLSPAPGEVSLADIVATIEQQYGTYNQGATATVS
nr:hypothetical protein [Candidatus Dormibacteraeota bacterium]